MVPAANVTVDGISTILINQVNGATYQAWIASMTGFNINTILASSSTLTGSGTASQLMLFTFASGTTLTAGTTYGIIVGRTDGSLSYALPIASTTTAIRANSSPLLFTGWMSYSTTVQAGATAAASGANAQGYHTGVRYTL